jgi:hypothetical protein
VVAAPALVVFTLTVAVETVGLGLGVAGVVQPAINSGTIMTTTVTKSKYFTFFTLRLFRGYEKRCFV